MNKIKTLKTTKFLAYVLVGAFLLYLNAAEISYSKSLSPEQFIQEGKSLLEKGDYEQSLQKLTQAEAYFKSIKSKSKTERLAEIYFLQGLNFAKQGNEKISNEMFKRALHYSSDKEYDISLMDEAAKEIFTKAKIEFEKEFSPKAMGMQGEGYKKKGGSTGWIVLAVIALAAVGVLVYFLLKKEKEEEPDVGKIQVSSSPSGAAIWLDGEDTGKTTSATLSDVSAGTHTLRLVKTGYKVWEDTVTVNKGATAVVSVTLEEEEEFGKIKVLSTPQGAAIWLDGQDTGETTDKILGFISVGTHTIKLVKERYQDWEDTVNVTENTTTEVNATLEVGAFTEDFNDNVADYFVETHPALWYVDSNVYKFEGSGPIEQSFSYYNLGAFANFTLEARGNREVHDSRWGIVFRGNSNQSVWYLVYLEPWAPTGRWSMWKYDSGSWTTIQGYSASGAINTGLNQWNKLKIVAQGEDFSVYINDVFIDTVTIAGIPSEGKIGLATYTGYDFVKFDDVILSLSTTAAKGKMGKIAFPSPGGDPNRH